MPVKLADLIQYIAESMELIMPLLNARSPKAAIAQLHFSAALCKAMSDHYPIEAPTGTPPTICVPQANVANNIIIVSTANDTFEIWTVEQVVALMYM